MTNHTGTPSEKDEYMNEKMKNFFKTKLIEDFHQLETKIKEHTITATQSNDETDFLDKATIENERALAVTSRHRLTVKTKLIKDALIRIDNDEYGYCTECTEDIGVKRLLINSHLPFCIDCADLNEKKKR